MKLSVTAAVLLLAFVIPALGVSGFGAEVYADEAEGGSAESPDSPEGNSSKLDARRGKKTPRDGWYFDGYFRLKYVAGFSFARADDYEDHDAYGTLRFVTRYYDKGRLDAKLNILGAVKGDLNGEDESFGPLADVYDRLEDSLYYRLYTAYFEYRDLPFDGIARLGRQTLSRGDGLNFDGLRLIAGKNRILKGTVFAGLPTYFRDSANERSGGLFLGGGLEKTFFRALKLDAKYAHIREEGETSADDRDDDLLVFEAFARPRKNLALSGKHIAINGKDSRSKLRLGYKRDEIGLNLKLSATVQQDTFEDYTTAVSPYYIILGSFKPYTQFDAYASQDLAENTSVFLSFRTRSLDNAADEADFNHSYTMFKIGLDFEEFFTEQMAFSITGLSWDTDQGEARSSMGVDFTWSFDNSMKASLGSDFELYKYVVALDEEKENVQTYYLKFEKEYSSGFRWRVSYALEDDEAGSAHRFYLSARFKW